jgi:small GTP-binding protein
VTEDGCSGELDDNHLSLARESLRQLLHDQRVPETVRQSLQQDYLQVQKMLEKIEQEEIHISVLGRVSVGKSSLLNALIGDQRFSTSPLHGETREAAYGKWSEYEADGVILIDTPGINEVDGVERERLAREIAGRSDIVLFVLDGDITETEHQALRTVTESGRPVILVLNKADRYTATELRELIDALETRTAGLLPASQIIAVTAQGHRKIYVTVDDLGNETETERQVPPDVQSLKELLWQILEREGKTLSALNATLFAGELSERVSERVMQARQRVAEKLIHSYCIAKGVAVALNPVPVADLMAALAVDISLIVHLSRLYGFPINTTQAGRLIKTITAQITLLMGSIWAIQLLSSVLKFSSAGLSTLVTGTAQGAVAYYGTYVVGQVGQAYLRQGKSWGEKGPKRVVQEILDSLDRESVIQQAREDILDRLKTRKS